MLFWMFFSSLVFNFPVRTQSGFLSQSRERKKCNFYGFEVTVDGDDIVFWLRVWCFVINLFQIKSRITRNSLERIKERKKWSTKCGRRRRLRNKKKNQQNKLQNIVLGSRVPLYCNVMLLIYRRFAWFE